LLRRRGSDTILGFLLILLLLLLSLLLELAIPLPLPLRVQRGQLRLARGFRGLGRQD